MPANHINKSKSIAAATLLGAGLLSTVLFAFAVKRRKRKRVNITTTATKTSAGRTKICNDSGEDNAFFLSSENDGTKNDYAPSHISRERLKERRRQEKLEYLSMKKPMYDNIQMLSPSGELLSRISKRKARWYVTKELANWTGDLEKQDTIQINFEPKTNKNTKSKKMNCPSHLYTISDKQNICVSCGEDKYHSKHYIVPYAYRSLLPDKYKSHMSHDVTVLCSKCRIYCEQKCQERMKEVEEHYRINPISKNKYEHDQNLYQVRSSATALQKWSHKIPPSKLKEHEHIVKTYFQSIHAGDTDSNNNDILTPEQLDIATNVEHQIENPHYIPGPEGVVQAIIHDEGKIADFVRGWRRHFVDTIHPRYMPKWWNIDNPIDSDS